VPAQLRRGRLDLTSERATTGHLGRVAGRGDEGQDAPQSESVDPAADNSGMTALADHSPHEHQVDVDDQLDQP